MASTDHATVRACLQVLARQSEGFESGITEVSAIGEGKKDTNVCIAIGGDSKNSCGARNGVLYDLLGMSRLMCNGGIRFTFAKQVKD
jgi:hypothetical protein